MTEMVSVRAARGNVEKTYLRRYGEWATRPFPGSGSGSEPEKPLIDVRLHPPTEAKVLRAVDEVAEWIAAWHHADLGSAVVWLDRKWSSMGVQRLPERLRFSEPEEVARFVRRQQHWQRATDRAARLFETMTGVMPNAPTADSSRAEAIPAAIQRSLTAVVELAADDFDRLQKVLRWLLRNDATGMFVRQLPIRGIDTKWIERHGKIVRNLAAASSGVANLGLAVRPKLIRVRFLDPDLAVGGMCDLAAPVAELAQLDIAPKQVVIVENLESLLALPQLSGVVAVLGDGYAVPLLSEIPWIVAAHVLYWGDLDSDGFNILSIARGKLPQVRSILMDRSTVESHLDLSVRDPKVLRNFAGPLSPGELDAVAALREAGDIRIEQERIVWSTAMSAVRAALAQV